MVHLPMALQAITSTSLMLIESSGFEAVKFNTIVAASGTPSIGKSGALTSVEVFGDRVT